MHTSLQQWQRYIENYRPISLRNKIVVQNQKLVFKAVRDIAHKYLEPPEIEGMLGDLFSIGSLGLIKAVERFAPNKGVAFSSFAVPYIKGEVQHWFRDNQLVKVPRKSRELCAAIKRTQRELEGNEGWVSAERIALNFGLLPEQWEEIEAENQRRPFVSLDELQLPEEPPVGNPLLTAEVNRAIAYLAPDKQQLIDQVFYQNVSIRIAARRCGLTTEVAEQRLTEALKTLRVRLESSAVSVFDESTIAS